MLLFFTCVCSLTSATHLFDDFQKPIAFPDVPKKFPSLLDISLTESRSLFEDGSLTSVQLMEVRTTISIAVNEETFSKEFKDHKYVNLFDLGVYCVY
jgi:hypothetical protein